MARTLDPQTGLYVDSATGAVSADPLGAQAITDPSLMSQAKRNLAVSHSLLNQLGTYGSQYGQAFNAEGQLSRGLNDTIEGRAPSVAQTQLEMGLGEIRHAQESEASGATGQNAALAHMNAMANTGAAGAAANQAGALLRAQEVAQAQRTQAGVLGNQANQAQGMYGANLSGATGFSAQAGNEAGQQAQIDEARHEANMRLVTNLIAAGGATAATLATGGAAAPALGAIGAGGAAAGAAGNTASNINYGTPIAAPTASASFQAATQPPPFVPTVDTSTSVPSGPGGDQGPPGLRSAFGGSDPDPYVSDRREKTDVQDANPEMGHFLDQIAAYSFDYKHPGTAGEAPGARVGVMAQDAVKSPLGREVVMGGKTLRLDPANTAGAALAAVSYLNAELKKLKAGGARARA